MVKTEKKRYDFIDLLKGICIFLVVWNHVSSRHQELSLIRVPLYFFLSGLFFRTYGEFRIFTLKKTNNLIVPFVFFLLISLVVELLFFIWGIKYSDNNGSNALIGPLWFLICLFWVNILYYALSVLLKNRILIGVVVYLISYIGFTLGNIDLNIPLYLDSALSALIFYHLGVEINKTKFSVFERSKYDFIILVILLIIFIFTARHHAVFFYRNEFVGNYNVILLSSFCGILFLFVLSKVIAKLPIVSFFGRYSIIVLGVHWNIMHLLNFIFVGFGDYRKYIVFVSLMTITFFIIKLMVKFTPQYVAQTPCISIQGKTVVFNYRLLDKMI